MLPPASEGPQRSGAGGGLWRALDCSQRMTRWGDGKLCRNHHRLGFI